MTVLEALDMTTGGVRSALAVLAVSAVISTFYAPRQHDRLGIYRSRTGTLFALAAIPYSTVHASHLMGMIWPIAFVRLLDLVSSLLAYASLIYMLAARALQRNIPLRRVRRAMAANASIAVMFVAAAWAAT